MEGGARLEETAAAGVGGTGRGGTVSVSSEGPDAARAGTEAGTSPGNLAAAQRLHCPSWCASAACAQTAADVLRNSRISAKVAYRAGVRTVVPLSQREARRI